jgi:hypothetical protein
LTHYEDISAPLSSPILGIAREKSRFSDISKPFWKEKAEITAQTFTSFDLQNIVV